MAFSITVILGQLSDHNTMLKEQADIRKDVQSAQRNVISEEQILKPRLREKANEHVPNTVDDNAEITERKEKK